VQRYGYDIDDVIAFKNGLDHKTKNGAANSYVMSTKLAMYNNNAYDPQNAAMPIYA